MAFAVIRAAKQKGGGVAASGKHNDRARETPNADKEKERENRVLVGDERDVKTIVTELIDANGGKPRSDSVEAIELLLTASREFFTDGKEEILLERVEAFVEKGMKFIDKN
ncbi:MAG TPA: plasmid recombination protein, partial [Candidatus Bathyarchaeia archaeon]|nr:plasmid recombination protein [Candidatus Bathyarchaeia archaeon]